MLNRISHTNYSPTDIRTNELKNRKRKYKERNALEFSRSHLSQLNIVTNERGRGWYDWIRTNRESLSIVGRVAGGRADVMECFHPRRSCLGSRTVIELGTWKGKRGSVPLPSTQQPGESRCWTTTRGIRRKQTQ